MISRTFLTTKGTDKTGMVVEGPRLIFLVKAPLQDLLMGAEPRDGFGVRKPACGMRLAMNGKFFSEGHEVVEHSRYSKLYGVSSQHGAHHYPR
jgi:hypothetical protein